MHPGDVVSGAMRGFDLGDDLVEGERRGVDHPRARRGAATISAGTSDPA